MRGGEPCGGDVGAVLLDQQGGFGGAVVEEALPEGDFGGEGGKERVGGEAVELGEGVVYLWVGLGASEVDTTEAGNGGGLEIRWWC